MNKAPTVVICIAICTACLAAFIIALGWIVSKSIPRTNDVVYTPPIVALDPEPELLPIEIEWRTVLAEKAFQ
jgi:hypothetical protein